MNRYILSRTLVAARSYNRIPVQSRHIGISPQFLKPKEAVDEFVEKELQKEPTRLPIKLHLAVESLRRRFRKQKDFLDPELKTLLDKASSQLYYDCANKYPYLALCEVFELPDYMSSWFKLTLMHVWMVLMRMHVALDAASYERVKTGLLTTLWLDVDKRLEIVGEEINQKLTTKKDMQKMNGIYVQTLLEYDEGFLQDDPALAAAVWRNLYTQRSFDPIYVSRVVRYMRATVSFLDTIPVNDLLVNGVEVWKPAESLRNSLKK
ncbi:hypothetical protein FO519_000901 [Halicephalobus sp. NKZ332]|nr:hypothetical protein FO519_000901 [Halicephalobus sp. NKZ332]